MEAVSLLAVLCGLGGLAALAALAKAGRESSRQRDERAAEFALRIRAAAEASDRAYDLAMQGKGPEVQAALESIAQAPPAPRKAR
jgi:hypothetical protein